jgi:hypothetical protein
MYTYHDFQVLVELAVKKQLSWQSGDKVPVNSRPEIECPPNRLKERQHCNGVVVGGGG